MQNVIFNIKEGKSTRIDNNVKKHHEKGDDEEQDRFTENESDSSENEGTWHGVDNYENLVKSERDPCITEECGVVERGKDVINKSGIGKLAESLESPQKEQEEITRIKAIPRNVMSENRVNVFGGKDEDEHEDAYSKLLKYAGTCMIRTRKLVEYRTHDRNKIRVNDKRYLRKLKGYIKKPCHIPISEPIKLGIDLENETALLWEGNHRITYIDGMKAGDYPQFVKTQLIFMNLKGQTNYRGQSPRLKKVPKKLTNVAVRLSFRL